jgi:hypothetical protein
MQQDRNTGCLLEKCWLPVFFYRQKIADYASGALSRVPHELSCFLKREIVLKMIEMGGYIRMRKS